MEGRGTSCCRWSRDSKELEESAGKSKLLSISGQDSLTEGCRAVLDGRHGPCLGPCYLHYPVWDLLGRNQIGMGDRDRERCKGNIVWRITCDWEDILPRVLRLSCSVLSLVLLGHSPGR
jgi:hypothetical protein